MDVNAESILAQIPNWFRDGAIVALCAYTSILHKKREEANKIKDLRLTDILDGLTQAIFGSGESQGLKSKVEVMWDRIDRCSGCNEIVAYHARGTDHGKVHTHIRLDKNGSLNYMKGNEHDEV